MDDQMHEVYSVEFGLMDQDEVQRGSVVNVTETALYDRNLPRTNAINDLRMGTVDRRFCCATCKQDVMKCIGHNGHMELAWPVYHIGYIDVVLKVLRSVCFWCSSLLIDEDDPKVKLVQSNDYAKKCISQCRYKLTHISNLCKQKRCCAACGGLQPTYMRNGIFIRKEFRDIKSDSFETSEERDFAMRTFTAKEAQHILRHIKHVDLERLGFPVARIHPKNMIITNLVVPPPIMRPTIMVSDGSRIRGQDDLTIKLQDILKQNKVVTQVLEAEKGSEESSGGDISPELLRAYEILQLQVSTYMNHDARGYNQSLNTKGVTRSSGPLRSIYFRLRGKKGRVRGNLMGKRCDFSSRTVITPDPYMDIDQIGVPEWIALRQTIPERVNLYNLDKLKAMVQKGARTLGGAHAIRTSSGETIHLIMRSDRSSIQLEPGDIVERYLSNDDWIMFNRQPSLHKQSIMGHRVKIMPGSTFRLPVCDTTPYNADFDGDEMNMHVCQSERATTEISEMMAVHKQIISPQSNKPIIGLVQDVLVGGYLFTQKDTFLTEEQVMDLVMLVEHQEMSYQLPKPAISKPVRLWTGKQIMSMILPCINLRKKVRNCQSEGVESPLEKYVLIRNGRLLAGSLCKKTLGGVSGGIIHITYKDLGSKQASHFIGDCQRVIHRWLESVGFSIGAGDCVTSKKTEQEVKSIISKSVRYIHALQKEKQGMGDIVETRTSKVLQGILDLTGRAVMRNINPRNSIYTAVTSGSKGNPINISQIMACVGQQSVEGKRINVRKNVSFSCYTDVHDHAPQKHGFVSNSYVLGLTPQEYFFHAMGGREGLVDTAVKTAATGYISRRLVKVMESIHTEYDYTVRSSSGEIIQFCYGGDGFDPIYIEQQALPCLTMSEAQMRAWCAVPSANPLNRPPQASLLEDCREEADWIVRESQRIQKCRMNGKVIEDTVYIPINIRRLLTHFEKHATDTPPPYNSLPIVKRLCERISKVGGELQTANLVLLIRFFLCTSRVIYHYRIGQEKLRSCTKRIFLEYLRSIIQPGEMVGAIAASSIGEPCTQMTLNTFHYAGVSSKNVTLGVPRFKELIDVSKNIKTPSLTLYLEQPMNQSQALAHMFAQSIQNTNFGDLVLSSTLLYEPDIWQTDIEEDQWMLEMRRHTPISVDEDPTLSRWVIRYTLQREMMEDRNITMDMVQHALQLTMGTHLQMVCTEHNMMHSVVRIRLCNIDEQLDIRKIGKSEEEVRFLEKVAMQQLQNHLLEHTHVLGLENIEKALPREQQRSTHDQNGAIQNVSEWVIDTEGTNLREIFCTSGVDRTRTISNDVNEIYNVLGIEAAALVLFNEIKHVLSFDGTYVNDRHMMLLVDTMTFNGFICPVSRHGMARSTLGPLMRSSFEETVDVLLDASGYGEVDQVTGVTENIMLGNTAPLGTGFFKVDESDNNCHPIQVHTADSLTRFPGQYREDPPKFVGRRRKQPESPKQKEEEPPRFKIAKVASEPPCTARSSSTAPRSTLQYLSPSSAPEACAEGSHVKRARPLPTYERYTPSSPTMLSRASGEAGLCMRYSPSSPTLIHLNSAEKQKQRTGEEATTETTFSE